MVMVMAQVYTITGEYDKALDQLEYLLSIPSWVTVEGLRTTPTHSEPGEAELRAHPRFEQILAKGQLVL